MAHLWERMTHIFAHRWTSTFGESAVVDGRLTDVAQTWAAGLAGISGAALAHGLRQATNASPDQWPTLPWFLDLCKPKPGDFGLPDTETAYREALSAVGRWNAHAWSHAAVYRAAAEVGTWALSQLPDSKLRPLFGNAYAVMVRRVMAGEELTAPVPKALPPKVSVPTSPEVARKKFTDLRSQIWGDRASLLDHSEKGAA